MIDKLKEIEELIGDELASASAAYLAAPFATEARTLARERLRSWKRARDIVAAATSLPVRAASYEIEMIQVYGVKPPADPELDDEWQTR